MSSKRDCRIYVGNLPSNIVERDLEDIFYKYGKVVSIDLKTGRGPPFGFVEFGDPRIFVDLVTFVFDRFSKEGITYEQNHRFC
ncbi:hypothetical protein AB6A40_010785 [Gnathostoma spinigerum]|uniref:RRM domain-containing protein n=1 Tax=Gnathostoma spinigerum TaxID=75299 RepID=A0ABD6EXM4_9BILA